MIIAGASSPVSKLSRHLANETPEVARPEGHATALIASEAPRRPERSSPPARQPSAPFVTHLLATRMQAPQTRGRRRAEPEEANAVYRSMTKPVTGSRLFARQI